MKTSNRNIKMTVLVLVVGLSMLVVACKPMSETIYDKTAGINGSFEVLKSGKPVNWLLFTPATVENSDFDLMIDTTEFKEGKQSLVFLVRQCSDLGEWNSPGFCKEYEAIPGERYKVSFWVKNEESEFFVKVGGVSAFDGQYETIVKSSENLDAWRYYEYEYNMPREEKFSRLRFVLNILSEGHFWIDDIKIIGVDGKSVAPTSR